MILANKIHAWWKPMLVILTFAFMGCHNHLEATRSSHVIYDEDQDEFAHLRVFRDIYVCREGSSFNGEPGTPRTQQEREADFDYLIALWKNRSDLIMSPKIFNSGESQDLYVGPREYRFIDLEIKLDEMETKKSPVDLSKILIQPGEFFSSPEGGLCYYHRCYFAGATVDGLLKAQLDFLNDSLLDSLLEEQKKRKELKEKRATWGDLRSGNGINVSQWDVLDSESVRLLIHQASGRQISLVRSRNRIELRFKLSLNDATELELTEQFWDEKVKTRPLNAKLSNDEATIAVLLPALELKTDNNGSVTVSINIPAMFPVSIPTDQHDEATKTPEEAKARAVFEQGARDDLATVKARGIPISRSVTIENVLADFAKGRKK